ncbi:MAG: 50S ribosomal protein L18 [Elusimicrobia bacterium]|nr:50S ribosomal protein L18 [Elusimicrobiota bacterium]
MSRIKGTVDRPRMSVHRSNRQLYVQIIDDYSGKVITGASTLSEEMKKIDASTPQERARELGKLIASKASERKITKVAFDRKKFKYHGNLKALAEGAREGGLEF